MRSQEFSTYFVIDLLLQDYNDYDPNDIPEDQAAPAPTGYSYPVPENPLSLPRRGREQSMKMMKHSLMKSRQSKSLSMSKKHKMMSKMSDEMESMRHPRRFTTREKSANDRILAARRQGRQIMSVREWLRRG